MIRSCKEATRLISEGLDKPLSPDEQLRLRAHLAICRGCRAISERLAFLRRAVSRLSGKDDG